MATPVTHRYGDHPEQVADLLVADVPDGATALGDGTVVLIHGGFWRKRYTRALMAPLADDLARQGIASWNVEYRRLHTGGGWPTTAQDVAAAIEHLRTALGREPAAAVGHSAGGHLALCMGDRVPRVVAQAAVTDLVEASKLRLGDGVVDKFAGEQLAEASPTTRAPLPARVLLIHGTLDDMVPPSQSERFAARGGDVTLSLRPGEGHMEHIDPRSGAWQEAVAWLTSTTS
ncbi:MAG TPA: alpha/beta fold hydrolase [Solirubrobacteraceae bacterium]|nr:alpha/beta fold hydrolase [Solirubrobacteraceae bacterium]